MVLYCLPSASAQYWKVAPDRVGVLGSFRASPYFTFVVVLSFSSSYFQVTVKVLGVRIAKNTVSGIGTQVWLSTGTHLPLFPMNSMKAGMEM